MARGSYSVLLMACMLAMSAHAQAATDAQQQAQAVPEADGAPRAAAAEAGKKEKRICRRETVTGSRFTQKVCMTQSEWDGVRDATKAAMRDMDSRPQNPYKDKGGG